jgi:dienelactone hydrolase
LLAGCAVGQAPGRGRVLHLQEPQTSGRYWLYLPDGYPTTATAERSAAPQARKWPLVVTFHGMKPWDDSNRQIREWQQEADRYGLVVCAPDLDTCSSFSEYPIRHVGTALQRDEKLTINILDDLARTTDIDPNAVLSTSWSMGGYLAHYMANHHPDRFSCVAVRQSNFSSEILDTSKVPQYRDHKIAIYWTQNDFAACKRESQEGARWYNQHGFDVTFAEFAGRGHERIPSAAANFFAKTCGCAPRSPPMELAQLQVTEMPIVASAMPAPSRSGGQAPSAPAAPAPSAGTAGTASVKASDESARPLDRSPGAAPRPSAKQPLPASAASVMFQPTPTQPQPTPIYSKPVPDTASRSAPTRSASTGARGGSAAAVRSTSVETPSVMVRVNTLIGISPLLVSFSAEMPENLRQGSNYLWMDNGEPVANGREPLGQKYLTSTGDHHIEVLVTAADGKEYRAGQIVTVLERMGKK